MVPTSTGVPRHVAATTPRINPITVARISATTASSMVAPSRPKTISDTGWFWKIERPMSPCRSPAEVAPEPQVPRLVEVERWRSAATASGGASRPSSTIAGSPGTSSRSEKTITTIPAQRDHQEQRRDVAYGERYRRAPRLLRPD